MNRFQLTLLAAVALLTAIVGCQPKTVGVVRVPEQENPSEFWIPQEVKWSDLTSDHHADLRNAYHLLVRERTRGIFPAAMAVVRVGVLGDPVEEPPLRRLVLNMRPEVDFLAWNSLFDDFRSVSEVFPLDEKALDGANLSPKSLIDAATALDARLLLVYAENYLSLQESEARGVLYEIPSGRLLAALHTNVVVDDPVAPDEKSADAEEAAEAARRDPRLVNVRRFEQTTREGLLALMSNDDPVDPVAPEGWIPDRSIEPLLWPPTEDLLMRRRGLR